MRNPGRAWRAWPAAVLALLAVACSQAPAPATGTVPTPAPTPNLEATIQAGVQATLGAVPTATGTPTPNVQATVGAAVVATLTALPSPTAPPSPTVPPSPTSLPSPTAPPAPTIPPVPTPAPSPIGSPVAGREYPAALREQFMQSCIASAKTDPAKAEGYCTCAMKKIEERFTIEEFVQLSLEMASSGKVPEKLLPVITDCISFLL